VARVFLGVLLLVPDPLVALACQWRLLFGFVIGGGRLVAVDSFSGGLVYSCSFTSRRVSASNSGMGRYLVGAFCLLSCPSLCSRRLLGNLAAVDGWLCRD
jgi:hypothetical protein